MYKDQCCCQNHCNDWWKESCNNCKCQYHHRRCQCLHKSYIIVDHVKCHDRQNKLYCFIPPQLSIWNTNPAFSPVLHINCPLLCLLFIHLQQLDQIMIISFYPFSCFFMFFIIYMTGNSAIHNHNTHITCQND